MDVKLCDNSLFEGTLADQEVRKQANRSIEAQLKTVYHKIMSSNVI